MKTAQEAIDMIGFIAEDMKAEGRKAIASDLKQAYNILSERDWRKWPHEANQLTTKPIDSQKAQDVSGKVTCVICNDTGIVHWETKSGGGSDACECTSKVTESLSHEAKESPLVVGRKYWSRKDPIAWLLNVSSPQKVAADTFCHECYSTEGLEEYFDLSRDWWAEEAIGKWIVDPSSGDPMLVSSEFKRDSTWGKQIESGQIALYPTRKDALEAQNG